MSGKVSGAQILSRSNQVVRAAGKELAKASPSKAKLSKLEARARKLAQLAFREGARDVGAERQADRHVQDVMDGLENVISDIRKGPSTTSGSLTGGASVGGGEGGGSVGGGE
jgi:hypothetical protein